MRNSARLLRLQDLIHEAQDLAQSEAHLQHQERGLTRLAAIMWVSRDVIDEVVEKQVHNPDPPEGRPQREHW
jgi:hypothetical protein